MKTLPFLLAMPLLLGAGIQARAQQSPYISESLNYSRLQFGGPARTQGIGGANVALGADFGNLTSNPAGLGLYKKSELHFSPGLGLGAADAAAGEGASQNQQKNSFHVASLGLVLAGSRADDDQTTNWRGGGLALGFTRLADFNTSFSYKAPVADNRSFFQRLREPGGFSTVNSRDYQNEINDISAQAEDEIYTTVDGLAFGTFLTSFGIGGTNSNPVDTVVITRGLGRSSALPVTQSETVTRNGSLSQFDIGYGANYKDRLYIGGAVGIVSSNNRQVREFTESSNPNDTNTAFSNLRLRDEVKTTGTGFNARVGVIYRATDAVRFGASIQTPTYIEFSETYNTSLTTQFSRPVMINYGTANNPDYRPETGGTAKMPAGEYAYALVTPFRASGGVAVTIGKYGFLTGDVEYVGYGQARLHGNPDDANGDDYAFTSENQAIGSAYKNAVNVRFGGEARVDVFRFRAGYARYGDPYNTGTTDRSQNFYTLGAGLRQRNFFLDIAAVYTTYNQTYSPYALASGLEPVVAVKNNRYTTNVTAGFTF